MCRASMRGILRLAPSSLLEPVGLRSQLAERLLPDEPLEERLGAFHLIAPDGRHWKGPEAVAPLLEHLRFLGPAAPLLRRSPLAFQAAAHAYQWVARNRGRLARYIPASWARPLEPARGEGPVS